MADLMPYAAMKDYGVPRARKAPESVKTGYQASLIRYSYESHPLRTLGQIRADIQALERETEDLLGDIIGASGSSSDSH